MFLLHQKKGDQGNNFIYWSRHEVAHSSNTFDTFVIQTYRQILHLQIVQKSWKYTTVVSVSNAKNATYLKNKNRYLDK